MEITLTGLAEVQRRLREAPAHIAVLAFAKALNRGAGVIAGEIEQRAEALKESSSQTRLAEHVIVRVEVDTDKRGGIALVGFDKSIDERTGITQDTKALWVEYGHRLVGHKPGKKLLANSPVKPTPFMRQAVNAAAERAIEVMAEVFDEALKDGEL